MKVVEVMTAVLREHVDAGQFISRLIDSIIPDFPERGPADDEGTSYWCTWCGAQMVIYEGNEAPRAWRLAEDGDSYCCARCEHEHKGV